MTEFHYQSPLRPFIEGMIGEKRSLGYQYHGSPRLLYQFDPFCVHSGCTEAIITRTLVSAWLQKSPHESLAVLHNRASVVRQLALYMNRQGVAAYVLPKNTLPKVPEYTPYLFSDREIVTLFQHIDACRYCAEVPLRHHIMPLLFRLLYGCGLRISEALHLKRQEVDLQTGVLTILDGKFSKDRWIALSAEQTRRCDDYVQQVHGFSDSGDYFFPAPGGQTLTHGNVYKNFRRFLWQARISHGGWGKGPRLHDFRHTFAVHCLRRWVLQGKDLAAYLPILKAYLGHDSFRDTARYLRLTAELYPDITAKLEQAFGQVIPTLGGDDHETD